MEGTDEPGRNCSEVLYVLNAERAREEQRLGFGEKTRGRAAAEDGDMADDASKEAPTPKKTGKGKNPANGQGKLF
jgi:hypothetical protein